MLVREILNYLEQIAPFKTAEEFDNVGLLIGGFDVNVKNVIVSLDVTRDVLKYAKEKKAQLIISHHPIIFNPVKKILKTDLIYEILSSKICVISAHTNLDKAFFGVSYFLAKKLKLLNIEVLKGSMEYGRIGNLKNSLECLDFIKYVSKTLNTPVRAVKSSKKIKRVAVVSGSGYFALDAAKKEKADAFITGESKHNILLDCFEENFCYVDASHFATENVFIEPLVEKLNNKFKEFNIAFLKFFQKNPCCYVDET